MTPGQQGSLAERRSASLAELVGAPGRRVLVIGASKDPNPKVTVVLFEGDKEPVRAIKVPLTEVAAASVMTERRVLTEIAGAIGDTPVAGTIPRVLGDAVFEGRTALVCSPVRGVPMGSIYHRWRHTSRPRAVRSDFSAAAKWLEGFQAVTRAEDAPVTLGAGVGQAIRARFGDVPAASRVESLAATFAGVRAPRTAVHGDFWFGNLFVDRASVSGVVDWEGGAVRGDPLRDLVRFPLAYALYLERHTLPSHRVRGHRGLFAAWGEGVVFALHGDGWFSALVRDFIGGGLRRLGLPDSLWRDAALLGVAEMAITADHPGFAERHMALFERVAGVAGVAGR